MMKNFISLFIVVLLFNLPGFAQMEKIPLLDNKLELMVPKAFTRIPEDKLQLKYPGSRYTPHWAITGEDSKVSLYYSYTNETVDDNGIPGFTDKLIADLKAGSQNFKLLDDGILLQDGKNIGYIKFTSRERDQYVFDYMFYMSLEDRLLLFNFNCTKKLKKKWESRAEEIAASLHLLP